jgi:hypothetical protein
VVAVELEESLNADLNIGAIARVKSSEDLRICGIACPIPVAPMRIYVLFERLEMRFDGAVPEDEGTQRARKVDSVGELTLIEPIYEWVCRSFVHCGGNVFDALAGQKSGT